VSRLVNPASNAAKFSATLSWQEQRITVPLLIDSGAGESFIDHQYAREKRLPLVLLDSPLMTFALDGHPMGPITHRTQPLTLTMSGNHVEIIRPYVIHSPDTPFILGRPWLELHTPHVCWRTGSILSWSTTCHARCLRGAQTSSRGERPRPTPPDLSTIPLVYHDLGEAFSKERARSFPPRSPPGQSSI